MKTFKSLDPHWLSEGERHGIGLSFECPCGCDQRVAVGLANPRDGGEPVILTRSREGTPTWWRVTNAEDFGGTSLSPSIIVWREDKIHWHGWVIEGEVTPA